MPLLPPPLLDAAAAAATACPSDEATDEASANCVDRLRCPPPVVELCCADAGEKNMPASLSLPLFAVAVVVVVVADVVCESSLSGVTDLDL